MDINWNELHSNEFIWELSIDKMEIDLKRFEQACNDLPGWVKPLGNYIFSITFRCSSYSECLERSDSSINLFHLMKTKI